MNAHDCRRAWLQMFLREQDGNRNELARLSGVRAPHITQMVSGDRGMGDKIARRLEEWKGLSSGTLDHPPPHLQEVLPPATPGLMTISADSVSLARKYQELSASRKKIIRALVDDWLSMGVEPQTQRPHQQQRKSVKDEQT